MNKFFILIFIIFTILFQFIHEVNTQIRNDPSISGVVSIPASIPPVPTPTIPAIPTITAIPAIPAPALPAPAISASALPSGFNISSFTVPTIGIVTVTARPNPDSSNSSTMYSAYSTRFLVLLTVSIIGGILVVIILVCLCYFLVKKCRNYKLNNNDISNSGVTNNEIYDGKLLPTTPTYIVISQEFPSNHNNQRGSTCDNSTNNEVITK